MIGFSYLKFQRVWGTAFKGVCAHCTGYTMKSINSYNIFYIAFCVTNDDEMLQPLE